MDKELEAILSKMISDNASEEELTKIKKEQLQYPWVLRDVIKNRT